MGTHRILLVEDNPDDEALACRALTGRVPGVEVEVVRDGAAAVARVLGGDPLPDIVLLDLQLPRLGGLDVLRQVRAHPRTRALPVVVLSASPDASDVESSYLAGANSYVRKPTRYRDYTRAVQDLGHFWLEVNERVSVRETA
jgi:two-component system response regulator